MNISLSLLGWTIARVEIDIAPLLKLLNTSDTPPVNGNGNGHKPANRIVLRASEYWARSMLSRD